MTPNARAIKRTESNTERGACKRRNKDVKENATHIQCRRQRMEI